MFLLHHALQLARKLPQKYMHMQLATIANTEG